MYKWQFWGIDKEGQKWHDVIFNKSSRKSRVKQSLALSMKQNFDSWEMFNLERVFR